jgi:hypothetical protein
MPTIINGSSPSITFSDNTTQSSGISSVAGVIQPAGGGTGQSSYTNGQLLIGNTTGNTLTKATLTQGSGISITNGAGSITIAATGGGTVTSVATGNGLSGGAITTTGTLIIACPTFNTVGSYCFIGFASKADVTAGSDYAAGGGNSNVQSALYNGGTFAMQRTNNLSGTWKWMGATDAGTAEFTAVGCRVS